VFNNSVYLLISCVLWCHTIRVGMCSFSILSTDKITLAFTGTLMTLTLRALSAVIHWQRPHCLEWYTDSGRTVYSDILTLSALTAVSAPTFFVFTGSVHTLTPTALVALTHTGADKNSISYEILLSTKLKSVSISFQKSKLFRVS